MHAGRARTVTGADPPAPVGRDTGPVRTEAAVETVRTRVARVLSKLGPRDRARAVTVAYATGLVSPRSR